MSEPAEKALTDPHNAALPTLVGAGLLAAATSSLIAYKCSGAFKTLAKAQSTGGLSAKARWIPLDALPAWGKPFVDTANYLSWVAFALTFGVVLGALLRAAFPARWLSRPLGAPGAAGILWGALIGAPLMLCSCCVAPVFDGTYARTRKLGPALALMLAAPGLNLADLAVVFVVFPRAIAFARLGLSLLLVLGASTFVGRGAEAPPAELDLGPIDQPEVSWPAFGGGLARALVDTARRSLPAILVGAFFSAGLLLWVPPAALAPPVTPALLATLLVASVATLAALPTFGEIPLGIALQLGGAPPSAVVAALVAGPIINLPSLLVLRRVVSARVAGTVGLLVLIAAFAGGELTGLFVS